MYVCKSRAEDPGNILAALASDFFQAAPAPDFFFPSGSGSWYFFQAAPSLREQKQLCFNHKTYLLKKNNKRLRLPIFLGAAPAPCVFQAAPALRGQQHGALFGSGSSALLKSVNIKAEKCPGCRIEIF